MGGDSVKVKKTAILAVSGAILTSFSGILNYFIPSTKAILVNNLISITGNVLLIVFFYVFTIRHQEAPGLRNAGVLGLIGSLIYIALNMIGMISNGIFYIVKDYPLEYMGLMNITSTISYVNFFIGIIPMLMILSFCRE